VATESIQYAGEIDKFRPQPHVGVVGDPQLVDIGELERQYEIGMDRQPMVKTVFWTNRRLQRYCKCLRASTAARVYGSHGSPRVAGWQ
jgi:hypothetical protein